MAAVQETVERVRSIDVEAYKYGFVSPIESDVAPKGLNEDIIRFISAKKGGARVAARMAARGLSPLADDGRAAVGAGRVSADRFPGDPLFLGAEDGAFAEVSRRSRSRAAADLRETRHSARRAGDSRRRREAEGGGRRRVRFRVGRHDLQGRARQGGRHLLLVFRGGPQSPRPGAPLSGDRRSGDRQLLCDAQLGGLFRRLLRLRARRACAARWSSRPISASTRRTPGSSSAR